MHARLGGLFKRIGPRKSGWQLAEFMGEATPDGVQHLLERPVWSVDAARDVLIVDETGFVKKGEHSAGVQRQYSGTAGRFESSQVGAFLCCAGDGGSTFIDRELYLPRSWCEDAPRCQAAGIARRLPALPPSRSWRAPHDRERAGLQARRRW